MLLLYNHTFGQLRCNNAYDRQLKGEDLQGLCLDDLMKLEKMVEGGLSRVVKTKVTNFCHYFLLHIRTILTCLNHSMDYRVKD